MSYKKRLILIFALIFGCCSAAMIALEYQVEQNYKRTLLQSKLEVYADMIAQNQSSENPQDFLPKNLRTTILHTNGTVIYDSYESAKEMQNHFSRPEIQASLSDGEGYSIRYSATTEQKYLYFAKRYDKENIIVRTALPFEISMENYFRPDWTLWISLLLFIGIIFLLFIILSNRYDRKTATKEEEKQRALKHQMTSNIAHELRTPVSSVRGYLETLVNNPQMPTEKRELFLERSYLQTIRLSDLIRDIALITKIEESPELFSIEEIDLRIVVDEVIEEFKETLAEHKIVVNNTMPSCVPFRGNYPLLYALMRNLVENTSKYAGDEVTINIGCTIENLQCDFTYYDTGAGVAEEDLEHIFERFYRPKSQTSLANDGSGLGLSIVRNAVAFHKGTIQACNRLEGGLEFHFTLFPFTE